VAREKPKKAQSLRESLAQAHAKCQKEGLLDASRDADPEPPPQRCSEIRRFLLRFAQRRGLRVQEHHSDFPESLWFCRLESGDNGATSVSAESADNALTMAFLAFENPAYNFLDE
jgi:hypothetical protein